MSYLRFFNLSHIKKLNKNLSYKTSTPLSSAYDLFPKKYKNSIKHLFTQNDAAYLAKSQKNIYIECIIQSSISLTSIHYSISLSCFTKTYIDISFIYNLCKY